MKPIALQLYTLREDAKSDFFAMLKFVSSIGYRGVEFAGLYGHNPSEVAQHLYDLGLQVCSSHVPLPTPSNVNEIADTEMLLGNRRVVTGLNADLFKTVDGCKQAAEMMNQAAELLKPYGITLGYHNHDWEFDEVGTRYAYDILMAECPDIFGELDVYWVAFSWINPVSVVTEYKARLPLLHIKDGLLQPDKLHVPVGSGSLRIPEIIRAADPSVLQWLIVELDAYSGFMPDAVRDSYRYLTENGLAEGRVR